MARADWILEDLLAHDAWIRALARKLVSDEHAAEDIAQEAWVEALEQPPSRPAKARPWLARVVRNLALKRRRTLERSQGREEKVARPVELPSAAELYEHEKTRYRVATEVFSLEEPYRTAILYRYFRGLKPREIADELGVSAAAVETRLRRGLEKLRARLDREFGDRASWCAALLPLIGKLPTAAATAAGSATGASLLTGALVMGTKLKIGLAALLVAASAVAFWAIWPRGTEVTLPRIPGADVDQPVAPSAKTAAAAEGAAAETAGADARTAEGLLHGSSDEIIPVPAAVKLVSLTGTVRSEDGKPIPDAVLTIEIDSMNDRVARSRLPAPRTTRTDAAGRYAFEELHPELSAWLTVSAAGFSQDALHVRAGDRQDIVLAVAGRIAGRVVDQESGQPVPRAVVWASNDSSRGRSGARSRKGEADAAGRFVIDDLRPGVYRLRTEAAHYLSDFRRSPHFVVQSRRTTEVELRLARGMTLRGQVLDARGGPVARARVGDRDPILTDAAGQFVLDGLESGAARIHIEADGKAPCQESVRFLQQEIAAGAAERTFRLVDAAILRGRVVGPDDHPVAGAGIRVRDYRPPIQADADGRFEVQLERPGKPQRFAVLAAGFAPVLLEPMTVAAGEIREDLVVKLTRGGAIEGRVETEAGAPISGQTVLLQTWPSRGMGLASAYRVTTTAADGRFRFDALAAGGYELSANGLNLPDREFATRGGRRDIRVAEGETMTGIVLVPTPRVALRGQTLDDRNRPLAGVRVVSWCGPSRAWSDENGRFTLEGMPLDCPCTFEVWKDDYTLLPSRSSLPGTVAADTPDLLIRMAPIPPGIRGHVLRADTGAPVPTFWIRQHRVVESAGTASPRFRSSFNRDYFQDAEGHFWLTGSRGPGDVALEAGTDDGLVSESPVRVRVAADVPAPVVELRLVAAAAARVRVLAPDGTPIAARVDALHPEDGRLLGTGWSFGDRAGIHVVEGIPPGPVQFRAKHDDWYDVTTTVCAESGRTIELDLQLGEEGAVLRVAVRDVADRAVAGARVRLFTPKGDEVYWDLDKYTKLYAARFFAAGRTSFSDQDYRHEIEQTSPEGRLERRFLPPGEYAVVVSAEGYRTERRSVSVRLETENTVEIVLLRAP